MTAANRAERRALARAAKIAARPIRKPKINPDAVPLRAVPWRVREVFLPLENILDRIKHDGTVEAARGVPVVREESGWYEIAPAIEGVVDFHRLAAEHRGIALDVGPLSRLATSLRVDKPITEGEIGAARACIDRLRQFALRWLTVGEAKSILTTVQISAELESRGES